MNKVKGGMQNAAHVAHSVWLSVALAAIQKEASQQRGWEEKRSDCNVHWMGMSGKMSRRVVVLQCRSQEINGGCCQMALLQLRTSWQQTNSSKMSKREVMKDRFLWWIPTVDWEIDKWLRNILLLLRRGFNMLQTRLLQCLFYCRSPKICCFKGSD